MPSPALHSPSIVVTSEHTYLLINTDLSGQNQTSVIGLNNNRSENQKVGSCMTSVGDSQARTWDLRPEGDAGSDTYVGEESKVLTITLP